MDKKWRLQTQMTVEARQRALISKEDRVKDSQRALFFLLIFYKGIFTEKNFSTIKRKIMQLKYLVVADIGSQC